MGNISPEVVLNSFIDFKLKHFTRQVFSLLWQCPYNIDTPTVKEECDILLWENNMCSLGKQDKDNCQHFIDRALNTMFFPKKAFCFLFHAVELPLLQKARLIVYKILLLRWGLYKKWVFYRKHTCWAINAGMKGFTHYTREFNFLDRGSPYWDNLNVLNAFYN